MTSKYTPLIYKIPSIVEDIFDNNVLTSSTINQPLFSLGFHSFIHRTKSAMDCINKLETKNEFYYVVNPFEHIINDYTDSIYNITQKYFNTKEIVPRSFYKIWEIITMFDIGNSTNILGLTKESECLQACSFYKKKYHNIKTQIVYLDTDKVTDSYDLIIDDSQFTPINKNYIEQEAYIHIFTNIVNSIKLQAKNGSFVLKVYDTFTNVTIKLIYLLKTFYEEVYIHKPFFSRNTDSEKYIICSKFIYDGSKKQKNIVSLENMLKQMNKDFIVDIFPKFILTPEHTNVFKYTNIIIINNLQISINMLVQYIKSNNYFGNEYHSYHTKQIDANKWWISTYFNAKPDFTKMVKDLVHYNESELNLFVKKLL
jgi:23S rRNA U2552 (ribose-2'-O)-methylase RlmE/FtsJ